MADAPALARSDAAAEPKTDVVADLAKVVIQTLNSEERIDQAKRGRERVLQRFTYEHNAKAFEEIFEKVITKR